MPSMAPPSAYQQPPVQASAPTSYVMTVAPAVRFQLPTLAKVPVAKPLPHPATVPGLVYQPKAGTIVGGPGGGLPGLPVPGGTITEEDIPTEDSLSDRFWHWWSPMPLAQKGLAAGAAVAVLAGGWWLIWGKKDRKAKANRRRRSRRLRRNRR